MLAILGHLYFFVEKKLFLKKSCWCYERKNVVFRISKNVLQPTVLPTVAKKRKRQRAKNSHVPLVLPPSPGAKYVSLTKLPIIQSTSIAPTIETAVQFPNSPMSNDTTNHPATGRKMRLKKNFRVPNRDSLWLPVVYLAPM